MYKDSEKEAAKQQACGVSGKMERNLLGYLGDRLRELDRQIDRRLVVTFVSLSMALLMHRHRNEGGWMSQLSSYLEPMNAEAKKNALRNCSTLANGIATCLKSTYPSYFASSPLISMPCAITCSTPGAIAMVSGAVSFRLRSIVCVSLSLFSGCVFHPLFSPKLGMDHVYLVPLLANYQPCVYQILCSLEITSPMRCSR